MLVVTGIMLLIVGGNALVVAAITRDRRRLGGVQNYFIASLAVSDLLVGLFITGSCVYSKSAFSRPGQLIFEAKASGLRSKVQRSSRLRPKLCKWPSKPRPKTRPLSN